MTWEGWASLGVVALLVVAMARNLAAPDVLMTGGLTLLLTLGIIEPGEALTGFANPGVLTVAALFIVAAGARETGGLDFVVRRLLGRPRSLTSAQLRMMLPVSGMSAFLNNTPVVAMMVPIVQDWSRRIGHSASKLLIPLSYASILGGTCTLIGTSTNLVVLYMAKDRHPEIEVGMFDVAVLGLPALVVGTLYILLASRKMLPDTSSGREVIDNPREYTLAMRIERTSPIVGQTIEEAGLRHLPGLYLVEIERDGEISVAVGPNRRLHADDVLVFAGLVDSVVDLRKIRGLVPATDQVDKLVQPTRNRRLVVAVVAHQSHLMDKNVRETGFRTHYSAAIIAVHRRGERIRAKIGDIVLQPGDTLLLEAHPNFLDMHKNDSNFALISEVAGGTPPEHDKAWLSALIIIAMIGANVAGVLSLLNAAFLAAGAMIVTRCLTGVTARRSIDLTVVVTIAAAFGVGAALDKSGAASYLGSGLVTTAAGMGTPGVLAALYLATAAATTVIGNNAAAALMFPIAAAATQTAGIDIRPCMFVLMLAASASFATPIGYQTNLMVLGPGGYRFSDFFKIGIPLQLLIGVVVVTVATLVWA